MNRIYICILLVTATPAHAFPNVQRPALQQPSAAHELADQFDDLDELCAQEEAKPSRFRLPVPHVVEVFFRKIGVKIFMKYVAIRAWLISCKRILLK